jgi:hypothetical protein
MGYDGTINQLIPAGAHIVKYILEYQCNNMACLLGVSNCIWETHPCTAFSVADSQKLVRHCQDLPP